jgi:hypothetical protein
MLIFYMRQTHIHRPDVSTIQTKQYPPNQFVRIKCVFSVLLLKIVLTCVDTNYETYQADICGDLAMCVSTQNTG